MKRGQHWEDDSPISFGMYMMRKREIVDGGYSLLFNLS